LVYSFGGQFWAAPRNYHCRLYSCINWSAAGRDLAVPRTAKRPSASTHGARGPSAGSSASTWGRQCSRCRVAHSSVQCSSLLQKCMRSDSRCVCDMMMITDIWPARLGAASCIRHQTARGDWRPRRASWTHLSHSSHTDCTISRSALHRSISRSFSRQRSGLRDRLAYSRSISVGSHPSPGIS